MNEILISILFALIHPLFYSMQYYFSKQEGRLDLFKKHPNCTRLDFIFVFFNLFLIQTLNISWGLFLIFIVVSFMGGLVIYSHWARVSLNEREEEFMYNLKTKKVTKAGIVHFIFQTIQASLILAFFLSTLKSNFVYLECILLTIFFLRLVINSKKIHGKILWSDAILAVLGVILIILKVILAVQ